jgi:uncharacterized RDD family membrane protein YckC
VPEATARAHVAAPLIARLASLLYEALLLAAVLWLAALPLALLETGLGLPHVRWLYQAYLVLVAGVYFVWQWLRGGQTLPMKTWRLKLERRDGGTLEARQAALRYLFALASLAAFGLGFAWALVDRDRLFLHDRLAGTRIVRA